MLLPADRKDCLACGKPLHGRTDKKFCNDHCRNGYNNNLRAAVNNTVRHINGVLLKNRRILESLVGDADTGNVAKEKLLEMGFQFRYRTHHITNRKGSTYSFCYDHGWLALEKERYLVVRQKEK
jgi:predicted nucleic acid-binding Zn ribbon protein